MNKFLFTVCCFFVIQLAAQSNQETAKAYFLQAQSNYVNGSYKKSIENLDKVKELLGSSNPMTLSLRYKSYYQLKDYTNAKKYLNLFFRKGSNASKSLKDEATSFIIKIDKALYAEKKRKENERLAEIERKRKAKKEEERKRRILKSFEFKKCQGCSGLGYQYQEDQVGCGSGGYLYYYKNPYSDIHQVRSDFLTCKSGNISMVKSPRKFGKCPACNGKGKIIRKKITCNRCKGNKKILHYSGSEKLSSFEESEFIKENRYIIENYINEREKISLNKKELNLKPKRNIDNLYHKFRYTDFIAYRKEGKWRFYDSSKRAYLPGKYDFISHFSADGLARVKLDKKYGYINYKGELALPIKYKGAGLFCDGLAAVKIDEKWGFINIKGEFIIPAKYKNANIFSEGLAAVKINEKWGFINKNGKIIIPAKYKSVGFFSEGFASVQIGNKWGYIDKTGKLIIPTKYSDPVFQSLGAFSEGLASVYFEDSNLWGFINKKRELIIPAKYRDAYRFTEGLAAVRVGWKWGFINKEGKLIIPLKFSEVFDVFINGRARVKLKNRWVFINKKGEIIKNI